MTNEADVVEVGGNVLFTGASTHNYLTAGVLKVGGDFSQQGGSWGCSSPDLYNNECSFAASGTHTVILNGTGPQIVSFGYPSDEKSHFQNLEIANTSPEGVTFLPIHQIPVLGSFHVEGMDPLFGGDIVAWDELFDFRKDFGDSIGLAFADIDQDGDSDMFVGQQNGTIHLYENLMANPRQGKFGAGRNFTNDNFARIPDASGLRLGNTFTVEFWMKTDGINESWEGLIGKSNSSSNGRNYSVWLNSGKYLRFSYHNTVAEHIYIDTPPDSITLGQWHHVAAVLDIPNDTMKIYIDGQEKAAGVPTGNPVTNDASVSMGKNCDGGYSGHFDGVMDEIRISDMVRYNTPFIPPAESFSADADTVALWHLNELNSLAIVDSSVNGHDGTWTPWVRIPGDYADIDVGDYARPAFADMDGDDDLDLFIGANSGSVWYYENTGSQYTPYWSAGIQLKDETGALLFPGIRTAPALADMDNDGKPELLVGYKSQTDNNGYIAYYQNTGTVDEPAWALITNSLLSFAQQNAPLIFSLVDLERDNDWDLVIGKSDGTLAFFQNIGTATSPSWAPLPYPYNDMDVGSESVPAFADLDNDGLDDLLIGNNSGYVFTSRNVGTPRITINEGQPVTFDSSVTLALNGQGMEVAGYLISDTGETPAPDATEWVAVEPTVDFLASGLAHTLEDGEGLKRVYVWFKDSTDSIYNVAYDTIVLNPTLTTGTDLTSAITTDFNQPILDQLPDALTTKYYSFSPGDWEQLMIRFSSDAAGDDYMLSVYLYDPILDEHLYSGFYTGANFNQLIRIEELSPEMVVKVAWIGDADPQGTYSLKIDTSATVTAGTLLWEYDTSGDILSTPAVSGNSVYVGSDDGKLYAFDVESGTEIWSYDTGAPVRSSPAVISGKVYVGSIDGRILCLDTETETLVWEHTTGSAVRSSPSITEGKVYVGSDDGKVYCLDAVTGVKLWEYGTVIPIQSSPAVVDGKVYVGSDNAKLYCLDSQTGVLLWEYETGATIRSSPALANGKIYFGSYDGYVYCLDAASGTKLWDFLTDGYDDHSSPAVSNGKVYVGSDDGKLYCLDADSGAKIWEYQNGSMIRSSSAILNNKVFFGSDNGKLNCLDAITGEKFWEYQTGNAITYSSPVISRGKIFVGNDGNKFYCLDAGDPNADGWPMFRHDLQHTGNPDHYKTKFLYGFIQAKTVTEFSAYKLSLTEVYEDNDFPVMTGVQFGVSDTGVASIDEDILTAASNGRLVISADVDGAHSSSVNDHSDPK
ncbi:PQQ-binding-like beta-propeller repeat protein [Thermodesulfobacteriota bacterium]